jgi:hypothetical protein
LKETINTSTPGAKARLRLFSIYPRLGSEITRTQGFTSGDTDRARASSRLTKSIKTPWSSRSSGLGGDDGMRPSGVPSSRRNSISPWNSRSSGLSGYDRVPSSRRNSITTSGLEYLINKYIWIATDVEAPSTPTVLFEDANISTAVAICEGLSNFEFFN